MKTTIAQQQKKSHCKIITGDFNAKIGQKTLNDTRHKQILQEIDSTNMDLDGKTKMK